MRGTGEEVPSLGVVASGAVKQQESKAWSGG